MCVSVCLSYHTSLITTSNIAQGNEKITPQNNNIVSSFHLVANQLGSCVLIKAPSPPTAATSENKSIEYKVYYQNINTMVL